MKERFDFGSFFFNKINNPQLFIFGKVDSENLPKFLNKFLVELNNLHKAIAIVAIIEIETIKFSHFDSISTFGRNIATYAGCETYPKFYGTNAGFS